MVEAENRAAIKSLENVDAHQEGNSTIGSALINVLFNSCSSDQLMHLGSKCGHNLAFASFNLVEVNVEMERRT